MASPVYRPRKPKVSPLWQCLSQHFDAFLIEYDKCYQKRHGFLRPIITEVVNKFLDCGDLEHGFARIRCDHCKKDHLLAFSCKGRWFCPSCHQKKVQLFGALLFERIWRHLLSKKVNIPFIPIHDAVLVPECLADYVEDYMRERSTKLFGYDVVIDRKELSINAICNDELIDELSEPDDINTQPLKEVA